MPDNDTEAAWLAHEAARREVQEREEEDRVSIEYYLFTNGWFMKREECVLYYWILTDKQDKTIWRRL